MAEKCDTIVNHLLSMNKTTKSLLFELEDSNSTLRSLPMTTTSPCKTDPETVERLCTEIASNLKTLGLTFAQHFALRNNELQIRTGGGRKRIVDSGIDSASVTAEQLAMSDQNEETVPKPPAFESTSGVPVEHSEVAEMSIDLRNTKL